MMSSRSSSEAVVIAIASGKGGVGKTWLSVTLAHALVQRDLRVLLVDCDLGLANVDIQLGLMADADVGSLLRGDAVFADVVVHHASGLDVLTGRSGSGELAGLGETHAEGFQAMIARVKGDYDCIVLDLGAGLDRFVRRMCRAADAVLVIATGEPTSLTDAYAVLKLYCQDRGALPLGAHIVVNQAMSAAEGSRTHATLARATRSFLDFTPPLAGVIRRDDRVRDAIRRQTLLLRRHPDCPAAHDVRAIAATLLHQADNA